MLSHADVHVHTKYSGVTEHGILRFPESVSNPQDVVRIAKRLNLDIVCITDHNSVLGAQKAKDFARSYNGVNVVVGEEISTADGEIIGLFLNEMVPPGLSVEETVDLVRQQDGMLVAPHPFSYHVPALGLLIDDLDIDAIEVINGGHIDGPANERALEHSRSGRWARVAGSDAHSLSQLGCAYTLFPGTGEEDFRNALKLKVTDVYGNPMPMHLGVQWSIGIVLKADELMLRSILGMLEGEEGDPIVEAIMNMRTDQKVMALLGSAIYLTPPIPYIAGIVGKAVMRKKHEIRDQMNRFRRRLEIKSGINHSHDGAGALDPPNSQKR
jgi:predicted metal-dependent phosphoesterase TrpH